MARILDLHTSFTALKTVFVTKVILANVCTDVID